MKINKPIDSVDFSSYIESRHECSVCKRLWGSHHGWNCDEPAQVGRVYSVEVEVPDPYSPADYITRTKKINLRQ